MKRPIRGYSTLIAFFTMLALGSPISHSASAEVNGSTYRSPTYGYTMSWPADWLFLEELSEFGFDYLLISDGFSIVTLVGGPAIGSPSAELAGFLLTCGSDGRTQNCAPVLDSLGSPIRGADESRAWAVISFDQNIGGSLTSFVNLIEVRSLGPGVTVLISGVVVEQAYEDFSQEWDALLIGVVAAGETLPSIQTLPETDIPDRAEAVSTLQSSAPVLASGLWRITVASASVGSEMSAIGLEPREGIEWLVIVADVTNWSDIDGTFDLRSPMVMTSEMSGPIDIEPASTRRAARALALLSQGNAGADIDAGNTERVVLIYALPGGGSDVELIVGESKLALDLIPDGQTDLANLPAQTVHSELVSGVLDRASVDAEGTLSIDLFGGLTDLVLLGIDVPASGECYSSQAMVEITSNIGSSVIFESDQASSESGAGWVWIQRADGSRTLLNIDLVASGSARVHELPESSSFSSWMNATSEQAIQQGEGLWSACSG